MNQKIANYRALSSRDTLDLSQSVEHWIGRGYQPFGPISCSAALSDDGAYEYTLYSQAMVEYEDAAKPTLLSEFSKRLLVVEERVRILYESE